MQDLYGEAFEVDLANPDYVAYARAFGVNAYRCRPEQITQTLQRALSEGGAGIGARSLPAAASDRNELI